MTENKFSWSYLHPKFWPVWLGFGLLGAIVTILPYAVLKRLGQGIGLLIPKLAKSRAKVADRNLSLAFPEMSSQERSAIVTENLKNTGLAVIETGMAWFWPNWRMRRHIKIENVEPFLEQERQGRGVLTVCCHALNLEITARAFSMVAPGYGVYRPHNNPAYDFIQTWGRTRFGNKMVDRKDVKGMLKILKKGGRLWYLPDHDYGRRNAVFVPFFAVPDACTTAGTGVLVDASRCAVITASSFRQGNIYVFKANDDISAQFPRKDAEGAATVMNKALEQLILGGLDQWMWVHKRYKTTPDVTEAQGGRYR